MPRLLEVGHGVRQDASAARSEPYTGGFASSLPIIVSGPLLYAGLLLLVALDVWVSLYQRLCFPMCGIALVRRDEYIVIDRWKLPYLNPIQKVNCDYCSYATGLIAYVREIAARTEQYWCPIKHSRPVRGRLANYAHYADYGDAQGYKVRAADPSSSREMRPTEHPDADGAGETPKRSNASPHGHRCPDS